MRKFIALLFPLFFLFLHSAVFASVSEVSVNGNLLDIFLADQPTIKEGRVLIPIRSLSESLGAVVNYDKKTVTVSRGGRSSKIETSGTVIKDGRL